MSVMFCSSEHSHSWSSEAGRQEDDADASVSSVLQKNKTSLCQDNLVEPGKTCTGVNLAQDELYFQLKQCTVRKGPHGCYNNTK